MDFQTFNTEVKLFNSQDELHQPERKRVLWEVLLWWCTRLSSGRSDGHGCGDFQLVPTFGNRQFLALNQTQTFWHRSIKQNKAKHKIAENVFISF